MWCFLSYVSVTFPYGVLGQVWDFIVSIPDLCLLPFFLTSPNSCACPFKEWFYADAISTIVSRIGSFVYTVDWLYWLSVTNTYRCLPIVGNIWLSDGSAAFIWRQKFYRSVQWQLLSCSLWLNYWWKKAISLDRWWSAFICLLGRSCTQNICKS